MEIHDYRVNASARQADTVRNFLRAESAGITLVRLGQPRRRWFGNPTPRSTATATMTAESDFQPGS